jgi:glycine/serine hydroxymethyltransferase
MTAHCLDRSLAAIQRHGGRIKEELNYRASEPHKSEAILHVVRNGMGNRLAEALVARNEYAIGEQIRHLQTIGLL